jgi:regulator of chromosome condensation (RCC1) repeat-containing protein
MGAVNRIGLTILFLSMASVLPGQSIWAPPSLATRSTPGQVCGLTGVVAVAAGGIGGLALKSDGTVWEWYGQSPPIQASELSGIVRIAAGIGHNMALKSDGTVWEWTGPFDYQGLVRPTRTPQQVRDLNGVAAIAAGESRSLAVKRDGTVWEWTGEPASGVAAVPPGQVSGLDNVVAVSVAFEWWFGELLLVRNWALKSDGTVWFWDEGPLGNGAIGKISELTDVVAISAGYPDNLALKRDGTVWEWSNVSETGGLIPSKPVPVSDLAGVVAVAVGGADSGRMGVAYPYGLALKSDGTVWAWGDNSQGQLGDGTTTSSTSPVRLSGIGEAATIAAAAVYTATNLGIRAVTSAVKRDGTVWVWGATWDAQICTTMFTFFPQVAVGGGYSTTVALNNTGSSAISGNLILRDQQGNAFTVSSTNSGSGSSFPISILPGAATFLTLNSLSPNDPPKSGWASVETTVGSLSAVETFQFGGVVQTATGILPSQPMQFATIPIDDDYSQIRLTAYALANPTNQDLVIKLLLVDQDGNVVDDKVSITLGPWQQTARYVYRDSNRPVFKGSMVLRAQGGGKFVAVALVQNRQIFTEIPTIASNASKIPN